ncbi:superoxide dismutase, Ni [Candidatus Saccharibacteria bacterium]|nr:superoxide dismutase, Ni [Candidatus Saccharibacteria bacterium]MCB9821686.1 superoxide dismutase, Ni [Candidatus Nomurabacteria bacterium]
MKKVYAHCDVPCGIYETDTMRHAADTCRRMVEKIEELGEDTDLEHRNQFVRAVVVKEEHAQKCKDQLYLLWSDYFKPEHLADFPNLHDLFWRATKQCGKVKQTVSLEVCDELIKLVAEVASVFAQTKTQH